MINPNDIKKIKGIVEDFFQKMTIPIGVEIKLSSRKNVISSKDTSEDISTVVINIRIDTPEILIGEKGRTLIEIQRLLRIILNKGIGKSFYIDFDVNDYKKKKTEYLKNLAKELADEVTLTREEIILFPMSAYERRIIHVELANRLDVNTESQGEEPDRKIVIKPC